MLCRQRRLDSQTECSANEPFSFPPGKIQQSIVMVYSPYSGAVPQASTSTGSLFRLQSEISNRARSKSTAADSPAFQGRYDQPSGYQLAGIRPGWSTGPAFTLPLADEAGVPKDDYEDPRDRSLYGHGYAQGGSFPLYSRPYANSPLKDTEATAPIPEQASRYHQSTPSTEAKDHIISPASSISEAFPTVHDIQAEREHQPATSNAHHIMQELRNSKDEGDTLDLSRKHIRGIDAGDVQILKNKVGRKERGVLR